MLVHWPTAALHEPSTLGKGPLLMHSGKASVADALWDMSAADALWKGPLQMHSGKAPIADALWERAHCRCTLGTRPLLMHFGKAPAADALWEWACC